MSDENNGQDNNNQDTQEDSPAMVALKEALETMTQQFQKAVEAKDQAEDARLRALAEAQNARRIATQEVDNAKKFGALKMVADIVGVLDNLDRAVQAVPESLKANDDAKGLLQGIVMIQGMLKTTFERHGIMEIEAKGQKFDPNQHQAVMQVPANDETPAGHVGTVMQRGYTMNGRVVRPAVVAVAM